MRTDLTILPSPPFHKHFGFRQRVEDLRAEEFVPQLPVERFDVPVLPQAARLDVQRPDARPLSLFRPMREERGRPETQVLGEQGERNTRKKHGATHFMGICDYQVRAYY